MCTLKGVGVYPCCEVIFVSDVWVFCGRGPADPGGPGGADRAAAEWVYLLYPAQYGAAAACGAVPGQYQLPLSTDDPALVTGGLQIMRDWAQEALDQFPAVAGAIGG